MTYGCMGTSKEVACFTAGMAFEEMEKGTNFSRLKNYSELACQYITRHQEASQIATSLRDAPNR